MSSDTPESRRWIHIALFAATMITVGSAGLMAAGLDPFEPGQWTRDGVMGALSYMLWLMAIVAAHEAGHYVAARRRGVEVSRPYFLPGIGPIPGLGVIPFFGTFGAFIRLGWRKMKAPDLMAIAGWGPVAGFVVTVPAVIIGVALSEPMVMPDDSDQMLLLGDNLLLLAATALFHPEIQEGAELMLHPIALAGWVGCLLTALNLLPIGQLDGGHLLYGVFGKRAETANVVAFAVLFALGIFFFTGWFMLAIIILLMGLKHPPMLLGKPAGKGERGMAWVCLVIFVMTFTPAPVLVETVPEMLGWF